MATIPNVTLNNGQKMPILGLGTYAHPDSDERALVYQAVLDAIAAGYRHIDTAWFYEIEDEVGRAVKDAISAGQVKRDELFIVTKLWMTAMQDDRVVPACRESLRLLDMDYVDLYLVHWPTAMDPEGKTFDDEVDIHRQTWQRMEDCVELGLTKSIGVSNYNSRQIAELLKVAKIKPVVNQVEVHPFLSQRKLLDFCAERAIVLTAFSPLGGSPLLEEQVHLDIEVRKGLFKNEVILRLAAKHSKSPGQIMLKFQAQRGVIVIPKSVNKARIGENANIFDFELDAEDIQSLEALNKNARYVNGAALRDSKNFPFDIEF